MEEAYVVPNIFLKAKKTTRIDRVDVSIRVRVVEDIVSVDEPDRNPIIKDVGVVVSDEDILNSVDDNVYRANQMLVPKLVRPRKV